MLTFLKTLFKKKTPAVVVAAPAPSVEVSPVRSVAPARPAADHALAVPQVAVARLSLLAILQKLPEDLRSHIVQFPDASVTIALPVATIQKQLAAGSVKMSLASLYRQSPAGTFGSTRAEEKRMIEVPLSEVLKHVEPLNLRRRADQRRMELPASAPQLFGDRANPFAIAPSEGEPEPEVNGTNGSHETNGAGVAEAPTPDGMTAPPYTVPLRMTPEPAPQPQPKAAQAAPEIKGEVSLPLAQMFSAWPEMARAEAGAMPDATLVIPAALLAPCLAKGKAIFTWGQVRSWMRPLPEGPTNEPAETEIVLPLKVVAPAFLAHSKPQTAARKEIDLDETIPALFDGGEAARPVAPTPVPVEEAGTMPEPSVTLPTFRLAMETPLQMPTAEPEPQPTPVAEPAPAPSMNFGPTGQQHWSPQQMIESTAALPGVAGAIVALREGLVVAAKLPENMKGDTVAAFLPQIFARLSHYTQEMQLGEVENLLLTINGAHFQSYHMGEIYFAVLGKAGEALPWHELGLVVQELQAQTVA